MLTLGNLKENFNPLPPHGGRLCNTRSSDHGRLFQSTPSAWRETYSAGCHDVLSPDFNPLPPHGGRPGDTDKLKQGFGDFNPLPPHGGRRDFQAVTTRGGTFQSTPSAWRETVHTVGEPYVLLFQSTPSAWRETCHFYHSFLIFYISIHSLRMEGDEKRLCGSLSALGISIHSLRMEGDRSFLPLQIAFFHFNPLPPHGGRLTQDRMIWQVRLHFNPLPPHGGRPASYLPPHEGEKYFNPLPPHGGRPFLR